jgi:hypothetical protein
MALVTEVTLLQDIKTIDTGINTKIGEVQAIPTVNTILGRLKDIGDNTALSGDLTPITDILGEVQAVPTANTILDRLLDISTDVQSIDLTTIETDLTSLALKVGEVQAVPTALTVLSRLKDINTSLISLLRTVTFQGYGLVTLDTDPKKIVTANTLRKNVIIQTGPTNGICYLGYDVNVTNINYVVALQPGDIYSNDSYLGDFYMSSVVATDTISFGEV